MKVINGDTGFVLFQRIHWNFKIRINSQSSYVDYGVSSLLTRSLSSLYLLTKQVFIVTWNIQIYRFCGFF